MPEDPAPLATASAADRAVASALKDSAEDIVTLGWRHRLLSHIPPGQFVRYLCVGVFNTLFGYTTFAVINYLLHRRGVPLSYIFASVIANLINITVAFFGYKFFVFRTRGNYLTEWLKAMAVYWSGFLPGIILLPVIVRVLNWIMPVQLHLLHHVYMRKDIAPYIANALLMGFGVIYSFIGHKKVTFRQKSPA